MPRDILSDKCDRRYVFFPQWEDIHNLSESFPDEEEWEEEEGNHPSKYPEIKKKNPPMKVQAALAICGFGIRGFDYSRFAFWVQNSVFAVFPLIIRGFSLIICGFPLITCSLYHNFTFLIKKLIS